MKEIDVKKIKELIKIMEEHNLEEIEIEREGARVKLKKISERQVQVSNVVQPISSQPSQKISEKPQNFIEITAPMVGTFYRAPSPGAKPYIEVGDTIEPGKVLCIIEAMKLMNEIKSEVKGKIKEILVENGEPVEFGQPLFLVESL